MRHPLLTCLVFFIAQSQQISLFGQIDSTNIPLFVIDTKGKQIFDEPKIKADLKIIYHENKHSKPTDTANIYHGNIGIEIRGKYSASLPQKPYGFETRDSLDRNLDVSLFHLPEENDWILLANYNDKTFMRNTLSFELFRKMGHYAPRTQFCEVMVNGQYKGIYILTEKIKRDKNRVDISKLTADENEGDDLTGGYIFKVDYYDNSNSWKSSFPPLGQGSKDVFFVYEYPDPSEITGDQRSYLQNFVREFESVLYSPNTDDRQTSLSNYMDKESFIDYFILNELARNVDGYKKSSFFHKDKDSNGGLLHAGPVWDFDWAWKNINECFFGATDGSGWAYLVHQCDPWPVPPTWILRLLQDPYFSQRVNERYFELRNSFLSEDFLFDYIDSVAAVLDKPQSRHFSRWQILGRNVGTPETDDQPTTYSGEIIKFKNWVSKRLNWLDANMPSFVVTELDASEIESEFKLYPNPASSQLTFQSEKELNKLTIYSSSGRSMISINSFSNSSVTLDIHELEAGIYMVNTLFSDGSQWTGKFVKN